MVAAQRNPISEGFNSMAHAVVDHHLAGDKAGSTSTAKETKYVYFFGGGSADGNGRMKDVLGGKGAGLAEMTNAGLPVPPGFTIQTEACRESMRGRIWTKRRPRWRFQPSPWSSPSGARRHRK